MLDRNDMLELTRRMTLSRTCFSRVAGCYFDENGEIDGSFNTHFLKLSPKDQTLNLKIAKTIPFSDTNICLKDYSYGNFNSRQNEIQKMLFEMLNTDLKNDALMEIFYEIAADCYCIHDAYGVFVYHGIYDIPNKNRNSEWLGDSDEIYNFMIVAFCPVNDDYEPQIPECGFMYPAFINRSSDTSKILIYEANPNNPHLELTQGLLGLNIK